jgi:hypothetical protein
MHHMISDCLHRSCARTADRTLDQISATSTWREGVSLPAEISGQLALAAVMEVEVVVVLAAHRRARFEVDCRRLQYAAAVGSLGC